VLRATASSAEIFDGNSPVKPMVVGALAKDCSKLLTSQLNFNLLKAASMRHRSL
jgi:hypothetical protein